jgi:FHA domain
MDLYDVLKNSASKLDCAAFVPRHRGHYLVGYFRQMDVSLLGFNTGKVSALPDLENSSAGALYPKVWRLKKSDRNTWHTRISVGRAKNNDVVIRERAISKLHAHFYPPKEGISDLRICDIGSENGTEVNGELLPVDEPRVVTTGDEIAFGGIACQLHDATSLFSLLK